MDAGALGQIVDAINGLGGDAKDAFIWYMAAWVATTVVGYLFPCATFVAIVAMILRFIRKIIKTFASGERLGSAAGLSTCRDGTFCSEDIDKLCNFIAQARERGDLAP